MILNKNTISISKLAERQREEDITEKQRCWCHRQIDSINRELKTRDRYKKQKQNRKKLNQLTKLEAKIEQNLNTHQKTLNFFEENDSCPTCTQPIAVDFKKDKITYEKGKVVSLNDGMKQIMDEIAKHEMAIANFANIANKINELNVNVSNLQTSIQELNK